MHTPSMARLLVWAALLLIVAVGVQTRVSFFLEHRNSLTIQDDSSTYISMAANLHRGIGWINADDRARFDADRLGFTPVAADDAHVVPFYGGIDLGYALCYWVALHTFGYFVPALLAMVYLQITADSLNVLLMFWLGRRILGPWLGLTAAAVYAGLWLPVSLNATVPFYYPWTGTLALWNLVATSLVLDERFPDESLARRLATCVGWGLVLGLATTIRSLFLPLGFLLGGLVMLRHRRHLRMMAVCVAVVIGVQLLLMMPVYAHNYARYGRLNTRWVWHTAYIGFGAHPNPWGIKWDDNDGFKRAALDGVTSTDPDFVIHYDDHMHTVVAAMYREQPMLVLRNALDNLSYGVSGVDGGLVLQWNLAGRLIGYNYQLPFTVPPLWSSPQVVVAVVLAFQFVWFVLVGRRGGDAWTYVAVFISSAFMLGVISALCPPYAPYNAAYGPGYAIFIGVAVYAGVRAAGSALILLRNQLKAVPRIGVPSIDIDRPRPEGPPARQVANSRLAVPAINADRTVVAIWLALFAPSMFVRHVRVVPHAVETFVALAAVLTVHLCVRHWLSEKAARIAAVISTLGLSCGLALGWIPATDHTLLQIGLPACLQILAGMVPLLLLQTAALAPASVGLLTLATTALHTEMLLLPALFMELLRREEDVDLSARLRTAALVIAAVGTPLSLGLWQVSGEALDAGSLLAPFAFLGFGLLLPRVSAWSVRLPLAVIVGALKLRAFPAWRFVVIALAAGWIADRWMQRPAADFERSPEPSPEAVGKGI